LKRIDCPTGASLVKVTRRRATARKKLRLPAHRREGRTAAPAHDRQEGLNKYLPPSVTSITVPAGFLEDAISHRWEVLAIEESGSRTLSSSAFRTQ
jgi:hypothetical protein